MKVSNQNCKFYIEGRCTHQAAPKKLLGVSCILNETRRDPRVPWGCMLQEKWSKPNLNEKQ